jgi:transaldolase/glucose-6-phosphate isomerase
VGAASPVALREAVGAWIARARAGDYVALHAYLAPTIETRRALDRVRGALLERARLATTLGFGPRFLHSTGQLHKGGANAGLFLQIVDEPRVDLPVPEADFTFGSFVRAQAIGDFRALRERGRRVLRVSVGGDAPRGLALLEEAIRSG